MSEFCIFIMETVKDEQGNYVPCIAKQGEYGHYYRTSWQWGKDLELAKRLADEYNEKLGLNSVEAHRLQIETMRKNPGTEEYPI